MASGAELIQSKPPVRIIEANTADLSALILRLVYLLGVSVENAPRGLELGILNNFIVDQYPQFTNLDILKAFEMAIAGKLNGLDGKPVSVETYGALSAKFIGSIMNAYKEYKRIENMKPKPQLNELSEVTESGRLEKRVKGLLEDFEAYKTKPDMRLPYTYADLLNELGVSLYPPEYTPNEKKVKYYKFAQQVKGQRQSRVNRQAINGKQGYKTSRYFKANRGVTTQPCWRKGIVIEVVF